VTQPLRIRRFRGSDLEVVFTLHKIGLAQVGLAPGDGVYYDDDFPHISEIYLEDRGEFLVGEVVGRVIAMGGLRRVDHTTAEMCRLRVHPHFQRRGYGTLIVRRLEGRARELGYVRLCGDTTDRQVAALALYRKAGWREVRRETRPGAVVIYVEKRLNSLAFSR
jgi:ribosomal protein S18 acetylase RimI-like enzyme